MEQASQRTSKEVIVFKKTENSQVNDKANGEQNFLPPTTCDLQPNSQEVVDHSGSQNKDYESGVPPHVKYVACTEEQQFTYAKRHAVEQHSHHQKKDPVLEAIE